MSVSKEEFDRIHKTGKKLKEILKRDRVRGLDGLEDYLVRAVEEARLTMRPADGWKCPECGKQNGKNEFCEACGYFVSSRR